jgi:hypothetical protein
LPNSDHEEASFDLRQRVRFPAAQTMSKPRFTYRVDQRRRTLRIALISLEKGDPKPFVAYLTHGGTIIDEEDRLALADALIPKRASKQASSVRSQSLDDIADAVLANEWLWRRANPNSKSLPNGYRNDQIVLVTAAMFPDINETVILPALDAGIALAKARRNATDSERNALEQLDELVRDVGNILENRRKDKARKPRKKV